jgi:hypothetical protein
VIGELTINKDAPWPKRGLIEAKSAVEGEMWFWNVQ